VYETLSTIDWPGLSEALHHSASHLHLLAQEIEDPDFAGKIARAWNTFVDSGQIWAMAIGIIFGYWFRYMSAS